MPTGIYSIYHLSSHLSKDIQDAAGFLYVCLGLWEGELHKISLEWIMPFTFETFMRKYLLELSLALAQALTEL